MYITSTDPTSPEKHPIPQMFCLAREIAPGGVDLKQGPIMPQRTNEFQELVACIQRLMAPKGAIVKESALIDSGIEGLAREIDVLIETNIGLYQIKIAVEAKDENRPMESTGFEQIIGKYLVEGGVKVNKIVVITHKGYSQSVIERAKKLDIDLFTLEEAKKFDWSKFNPNQPKIQCLINIDNIQIDPNNEKIIQFIPKGKVVCLCGRHQGILPQLAHFIFWNNFVKKNRDLIMKLDEEIKSTGKEKKIKITFPFPSNDRPYFIDDTERNLLEKISFDVQFKPRIESEESKIEQIHFSIAPHISSIKFNPTIEGIDTNKIVREGRLVCSCCGKDHGNIEKWIQDEIINKTLSKYPEVRNQFLDFMQKYPRGAVLGINWPLPDAWRIRYENKDYIVNEIEIKIHAISTSAPLERKQYELKDMDGQAKYISQLHTTVAGKEITITLPEGTNSQKICVKIDDAKPKKEAT
jgi:hypothetical protein